MARARLLVLLPALAGGAVAGCGGASSVAGPASATNAPAVLTLSPANGMQSVSPLGRVVVTFSRAMMAGMESSIVLHEGTVNGTVVKGTATWSADRMVLTFMPAAPLRNHTTYVLHMSPGLRGQNGQAADLGSCTALGGQSVSAGMMGLGLGGGMMNDSWGPGMMGDGWRAGDGTFGMYFTFTTS